MEANILLLYSTGPIPAFITGKPLEEADPVLAPYRAYLMEHKAPC